MNVTHAADETTPLQSDSAPAHLDRAVSKVELARELLRRDPESSSGQEAPLLQVDELSQANPSDCPALRGQIVTSRSYEVVKSIKDALPLIPTFLLQFSIPLATQISVGHLGTNELGAVGLGSMTANITGMTVCSGFATTLDTLCPQAYGSGRRMLVGLQVQRMVIFLWVIAVPIGIIWLFAPYFFSYLAPNVEVAQLASRYLLIYWFGLPGFAAYAGGKRFLQAQGNFWASLCVIAVVAPLGAFLNWFLVWYLNWGFDGAPIAAAISQHLLWIGQVVYVYFFFTLECWPGLSWQMFRNWVPMIRLAVPTLMMIEAEVVAFEILTFLSGFFGPAPLAANVVLFSAVSFAFQFALPYSVAVGTRIAHLIGARSPDAAKVSAQVGFLVAGVIGIISTVTLLALEKLVPRWYSSDPEVWQAAAEALPLCAIFLLLNALSTACNGLLRGIGRPSVGGYIQLFCHYSVGLPLAAGLAFGPQWQLRGLWKGLMVGMLWYCLISPY